MNDRYVPSLPHTPNTPVRPPITGGPNHYAPPWTPHPMYHPVPPGYHWALVPNDNYIPHQYPPGVPYCANINITARSDDLFANAADSQHADSECRDTSEGAMRYWRNYRAGPVPQQPETD